MKAVVLTSLCLPEGQAPAALEQKNKVAYRKIERFGKNFGKGKKWQPPSEQEFNKPRDQQKKALLGMKFF